MSHLDDDDLDALLGSLGPPAGSKPEASPDQILALAAPPVVPAPAAGATVVTKWVLGGAVMSALVAGFVGGAFVTRALTERGEFRDVVEAAAAPSPEAAAEAAAAPTPGGLPAPATPGVGATPEEGRAATVPIGEGRGTVADAGARAAPDPEGTPRRGAAPTGRDPGARDAVVVRAPRASGDARAPAPSASAVDAPPMAAGGGPRSPASAAAPSAAPDALRPVAGDPSPGTAAGDSPVASDSPVARDSSGVAPRIERPSADAPLPSADAQRTATLDAPPVGAPRAARTDAPLPATADAAPDAPGTPAGATRPAAESDAIADAVEDPADADASETAPAAPPARGAIRRGAPDEDAPTVDGGPAGRFSVALDATSRDFPSRDPAQPVRVGAQAGVDLRYDLLGEGRWRPTLGVGADFGAALAPAVGQPVISPHATAELALQLGNVAPTLGWVFGADWSPFPDPPGPEQTPEPGLVLATGGTAGVDIGRADGVQLRLRVDVTAALGREGAGRPHAALSAGVEIPLGKR